MNDHQKGSFDEQSPEGDHPVPNVNNQTFENKLDDAPQYSASGSVSLAALFATGKAEARHSLPNVLRPLMELRQWVCWRWVLVKGKNGKPDKWTKVPFQPNGRKARTNDPSTWSTFQAVLAASDKFDGIGIVVQGFGAFDIDDCVNLETGEMHEWARQKVDEVGSYAEVTVSGTGLRIIGMATGGRIGRKIDMWQTVCPARSTGTPRAILS
jgi:hypothetical protein